MSDNSLLRRQVTTITLLVAVVTILVVCFNLCNLAGSLTSQIGASVDAVAYQTEKAVIPMLRKSENDELHGSLAPQNNAQIGGFLPHYPAIQGISITDSKHQPILPGSSFASLTLPDFQVFRTETSALQFRDLLSVSNPMFRYNQNVSVNGESLGEISLDISLASARVAVIQSLWSNLFIALGGILTTLFLANFSTRQITAPLSIIASSIEQIEQNHSLSPAKRSDRDKSNYMEMVADRIQQIGKHIAGDRTELLEARGRLDQILSNLQEHVLLVNFEGRVMLASPGVADLLGAKGPPKDQILEDFVGFDHPLVILVRLALASGESTSRATLPEMNDRRSKPLAVTVQLIVDRGETAGAFISLHDRETVAKLESQLDYSERLADLARITSGIAHEVKNPLNAMVIHLELLREKLERSGPQTVSALPQVEILTSEIRRLDRVVQTFLNFTKAPRLQLRPLDVNQVLKETLALAEAEAQAHYATVEPSFSPDLPRIAGDADLLKQAFLNIIINGFQAMEDEGILRVQTTAGIDRIKISITDHGKGIDQSSRERIFQLYYSTKPEGNGIGLAQAYRAIQLHNGRIAFTSQPGVGTTFEITIPAA
jgi:signal transduction histidine kinase